MAAQKDLVNLLLSLFSADELRRWLRYLDGGDKLAGRLPGFNASPASLASEAVVELERDGMINKAFWERMVEERPRRKADIDRVRAMFPLGHHAEATNGGDPPASFGAKSARITVLLVSASPANEVRLRVDREFRDVISRMRGVRHRDRFAFIQVQAARLDDLRTALLEHQPCVLHISTHGDAEGNLTFEGSGDGSQQVTQKRFARMLAAAEGLRLVVLNACHSEVLASKISDVVGLAIGMNDSVADQAAIDFSLAFYECLGFGKSIETAFRVALAGLEDRDDGIPVLFPLQEQDKIGRRASRLIVEGEE